MAHSRRRFVVVLALGGPAALAGCVLVSGLGDLEVGAGDCVECDASTAPVDGASADGGGGEGGGGPVDASLDALGQIDASDAAPAPCNLSAPFGEPVLIATLNKPGRVGGITLTPDELTAYLSWYTGSGSHDLYVTTRETVTDTFGAPIRLDSLSNGGDEELDPAISADGLTLLFARNGNIRVVKRANPALPFDDDKGLAFVNTGSDENSPFWHEESGTLWFASDRSNGVLRIYRGSFDGSNGSNVQAETSIAPSQATAGDVCPVVTRDGRAIYFSSTRDGGKGMEDIWVARRATSTGAFGEPTPVAELNSPTHEYANWISYDECRIYFTSDRTGSLEFRIYVAERPK